MVLMAVSGFCTKLTCDFCRMGTSFCRHGASWSLSPDRIETAEKYSG
jgi:hypothetical protein